MTFGIDLMIDSLEMLGLNVAATAKTAEHIQAVLAFAIVGVVASIIVYSVVARRPAGSGPGFGPPGGCCPGSADRDHLGKHGPGLDFRVFHLPMGSWCVLCLGRRTVVTARRLLPQFSLMTDSESSQRGTRSVKVVGRRKFLIQIGQPQLPSRLLEPAWGASSK